MPSKMIFRTLVTETSTTASDLGTPGEYREDLANGRLYKLVYDGNNTVADGGLLQLDSVSGTDGFTVEQSYSTNIPAAGVNNNLASLASGVYFFALVRGPGYCDLGENLTANYMLSPSTGGLVRNFDSVSGAAHQAECGRSIVSVASASALTAFASASQVYFNCE